MSITLTDRAPLQNVRKLADGRLAAVAKFARSGVYRYAGHELGKPHLASVNVYRDEVEVFDEAAMASFAHKAITLDHPTGSVTADNWKRAAVGYTEGRVARDGEFVEIPLMLADAEAVRAYESGRARELSAGYTCDLVWQDGIAPDGTPYNARQVGIRGNHIALVAQGRAGSRCAIGDSAHSVADQEINDAYSAMVDHLTGAWRRGRGEDGLRSAPQVRTRDATAQDVDAAYQQMVADLTTPRRPRGA